MRQMFSSEQIEKFIESKKVPLYRHSVAIKGDNCSLALLFINSNSEDFDDVALIEALYENDIIAPITGAIKVGAGYLITSYAVFNETDNDYYVRGISNSGNIETGSTKISLRQAIDNASYIVDDVTELK